MIDDLNMSSVSSTAAAFARIDSMDGDIVHSLQNFQKVLTLKPMPAMSGDPLVAA